MMYGWKIQRSRCANRQVSLTNHQRYKTLVPREVKKFCLYYGISANKANIVAVAAEETIVNCIKYGGRLSHWIDVSLVIEEQKMLLRIRDNGAPFNPTEYEFDSGKFDIK